MGTQLSLVESNWAVLFQNKFMRILQNKLAGNQIEEYTNTFGCTEELVVAVRKYDQRTRTQQDAHVQFVGYRQAAEEGPCSTYRSLKVYVERVPKRLSDLHLSEQKALIVLRDCAKGFSSLANCYPLDFRLSERMIGVDAYDQIKVWINEDFSKMTPPNEFVHKTRSSEEFFLDTLIKVVSARTPSGRISVLEQFKRPITF